LRAFLRHSFHRGVVFVDGPGRRESRFFPVVVAFYPTSVALVLTAVWFPLVAAGALAVASLAAGALGVARRRRPREVAALALLAPVYGVMHGAGMWRGLVMLVGRRGPAPQPEPPA
jgi:hypothetical protein